MDLFERLFGNKERQTDLFASIDAYRKEMESTRRRCESILIRNPTDAHALYDRARCREFDKDYAKAIEDLDTAISVDPGLADAWLLRGQLYANEKKDFRKAMVDAQKVLSIDPRHYDATYLLGRAYFGLEMLPEALSCFENCKTLDPTILNPDGFLRDIRKRLFSKIVRPLDLWSDSVFSHDEMLRLEEALQTAPIVAGNRIREELFQKDKASGYVEDMVEGPLEQILERLMGDLSSDGNRSDFIGVRANWVDNEYVNVSTWVRPPNSSQATFFIHLIVRESENVYCLIS